MTRRTLLLVPLLALGLAACSSTPEMDRPAVPGRPEVLRPEGVEPDGLADYRDAISEQRAAARERDNALNITPNELSTHPNAPWYESALSPLADLMQFLRNNF